MNFKKSLTALAVAGVIATPMAAQADLYASARIGLLSDDTGGEQVMTVSGVASRMGIKSETDLGNGMTAFGKYEFGVSVASSTSNFLDNTLLDSEGNPDSNGSPDKISNSPLSTRHAVIGLKGDFGSVMVGQTYHTFYNHVVGPMDIPWIGSGVSQVAYVGRTSDALTYSGGTGDISFGATVYMQDDTEDNGEEDDVMDGTEFGASFGLGGMTLGVAMKDAEAFDDAQVGVALHGIDLGGASLGIGFQTQGDDSSVLVHADIGNAYAHLESLDIDGGNAPSTITLGYNMSLGPKTLMYFEYVGTDADTGDSDDDRTRLAAVLKYDIE